MSSRPVTSMSARKRGTTRFLTGSTPSTWSASSSSRILRAPRSAVIAVPATPATIIESTQGANSPIEANTKNPRSRVSAELWASGRHLHAPPAHQHPDEAEPRRRVVVLAARLSDVVVGEPLPFVTCRVRGDRFQPRSVLLLRIGALAQRVADLL